MGSPAKYGWVCEHDPYDPSFVGRKHTALGRFRHENTAFRALPNKPFVLYMGDDIANGGVYKFVSDLPFRPGRREENLRILQSGKLYIARWEPGGRRMFDAPGGRLTSIPSGTGTWREVLESELVDTNARIAAAVTAEAFRDHYATNRPEDVEVDEDGTVYIALTNNSTVNDTHGSIRRLHEAGNDPTALQFTWEDFAAGGPTGRAEAGEQGFSSPDNIVFDKAGNLWVVTDISSSVLNNAANPNAYHRNNAVFMVPRTGPNAGIGFRFANMPIEAEGTGPYFTPDEQTLFVNVQHPGEETPTGAKGGVYGNVEHVHLVLAQGQQDDGPEPVDTDPVARRDLQAPARRDASPPGGNVIPTPPPAPGADRTPTRLAFVLRRPPEPQLADRVARNGLHAARRRARDVDGDALRPAHDAQGPPGQAAPARPRHPARHRTGRGHGAAAPVRRAPGAAAPRARSPGLARRHCYGPVRQQGHAHASACPSVVDLYVKF